jgi:hypothetical protein
VVRKRAPRASARNIAARPWPSAHDTFASSGGVAQIGVRDVGSRHGELRELFPGIHFVTGTVAMGSGIRFSRNMTVLAAELGRWAAWHKGRTVVALLAFAGSLLAL